MAQNSFEDENDVQRSQVIKKDETYLKNQSKDYFQLKIIIYFHFSYMARLYLFQFNMVTI